MSINNRAETAAPATAATDCLHTEQLWNIAGTHGHCKHCGKQFGADAGGPDFEVAPATAAKAEAPALTDEQIMALHHESFVAMPRRKNSYILDPLKFARALLASLPTVNADSPQAGDDGCLSLEDAAEAHFLDLEKQGQKMDDLSRLDCYCEGALFAQRWLAPQAGEAASEAPGLREALSKLRSAVLSASVDYRLASVQFVNAASIKFVRALDAYAAALSRPAQAQPATSAQPAPAALVQYEDVWGCGHTLSLNAAALELKQWQDAWPGGLEEVEAALTAARRTLEPHPAQPATKQEGGLYQLSSIEVAALERALHRSVRSVDLPTPDATPTSPGTGVAAEQAR